MSAAQTLPTPEQAPTVLRERTRDLHPGWFASVMGTGILAVATYGNPGGWEALAGAAHLLGAALAGLAYVLGVILLWGYVVRWVRHTSAALADFRNPVKGAMHATLPGGLLVLAVMTSVVGPTLISRPGGGVGHRCACRARRSPGRCDGGGVRIHPDNR